MKRAAKNGKRAAFSVVELLVAFSISSVMMTLLLSSFQTIRSHAERYATLSQMRQMGLAVQLYATENNCTLPPVVTLKSREDRWPRVLSQYIQSPKVYAAPGDRDNYIKRNADPLSNDRNNTSYIMNGFEDIAPSENGRRVVRLANIPKPSKTFLFGVSAVSDRGFHVDVLTSPKKDLSSVEKLRFGGGSMFIFADGSAAWLASRDYKHQAWYAGSKNTDNIR